MSPVFADAAYWIAITDPTDQWHEAAIRATFAIGDVQLVTIQEVLAEFLTSSSRLGPTARHRTASAVRNILQNPGVRVIEQSQQSFLDGLARYEQRTDKGYSLQDCIAMNVMEAEGITQVLTSDHNFEQEGFIILMKLDR